MPERADPRSLPEAMLTTAAPGCDAARVRFAAARVRALEGIELRLLESAVRAPDDAEARRMELHADTAWRDAQALRSEHSDDGRRPAEPA